MSLEKNFNSLGKKLTVEAIIKSVLVGVVIGGGAAFITAFVSWFLAFNGVLATVAAFAVFGIGSGVLFYFLKFRPTVKSNARRLDSYGLDERLITMVELEGNDSFIAQLQREDAVKHVSAMDQKKIKFKFSRTLVVLTVVFAILAASMGAVEGLSAASVIPSGSEVWNTLFPPPPPESFKVTYVAGKGGYILGNAEQSVVEGTDGELVVAVADDGFMFYGWNDGNTDPARMEKNVNAAIERTAYFIAVDDGKVDDSSEDEPNDVPGEEGPSNKPGEGESGGGGKYTQNNFIIDGKTYYRTEGIFEEYFEKAMKYAQEGEALPDDIRKIIELYFKVIK